RSSAGESVRARRSRASRSSPRCRSRSPAMWRAFARRFASSSRAIWRCPSTARCSRRAVSARTCVPSTATARCRRRLPTHSAPSVTPPPRARTSPPTAMPESRSRRSARSPSPTRPGTVEPWKKPQRGSASRRPSWGWGPAGRGEPVDLRRLALAALSAGCAWGGQDEARLLPADRSTAVTYVALGDSTVEGVGASSPELNYVSRVHARLGGVYPAARLTNLGVGGATSADVLLRQLTRVIELRPYLVTISIGPNDITGRVQLDGP